MKINKRNNYVCVIIKVNDEATFKKMVEAGKVRIKWCVCKLFKVLPMLKCYKCNRFSHGIENCTSSVEICAACTGDHHSSNCNSKVYKCINCIDENLQFNLQNPISHPSWSMLCPIMRRKWSRTKRNARYQQ